MKVTFLKAENRIFHVRKNTNTAPHEKIFQIELLISKIRFSDIK